MKLLSQTLVAFSASLLIACGGDVQVSQAAETSADITIPDAYPDVPMASGDLAGLYKNAGEESAVVLIIPGSGPTDLNGNNASGGQSNSYKYLAEGLAENAISSVRVDKRGMFSSAAAGDPNQVTAEIYAQDYSDWVNTIRAETGADCVYILGHSEGAMMGSAAALVNKNVCGLILVSGAGRPLGDVLREQLKANPANRTILKEAFEIIEKLEQGKRVPTSNMNRALRRSLFPAEIQDFWISTLKIDPEMLAKAANKKTLVIQGETDLQTSIEDAKRLAEATGGKLVLLPGVNHVLKEAPMNRRKNFKTYNQPDVPISPAVGEAIATFVVG